MPEAAVQKKVTVKSGVRHTAELHVAILNVLIYFDVFSYPLQAHELLKFSNASTATQSNITATLEDFIKRGIVFQHEQFFGTRPIKLQVERRIAGNELAEKRMNKAGRMCRLIAKFPYVEAVMISGSLSKGFMPPDGDIDQFIVTKPGRLWVARTLLILYKKVFLLNSHRDLCVNYFIASDDLRIEDENLFTATELITLLPMVNPAMHEKLLAANPWATDRFPNYTSAHEAVQNTIHRNFFRRSTEWILNGKLGEWADEKCMRITVSFWQRKFKHFDASLFDVAMRSRRNVSKHHPNNFQKKVLDAFHERATEIQEKFGITM